MLAVCAQVHIEWNNGNVCNANEGIPRNMTAIATQLGCVGYVSHQLGKWWVVPFCHSFPREPTIDCVFSFFFKFKTVFAHACDVGTRE